MCRIVYKAFQRVKNFFKGTDAHRLVKSMCIIIEKEFLVFETDEHLFPRVDNSKEHGVCRLEHNQEYVR